MKEFVLYKNIYSDISTGGQWDLENFRKSLEIFKKFQNILRKFDKFRERCKKYEGNVNEDWHKFWENFETYQQFSEELWQFYLKFVDMVIKMYQNLTLKKI